MRPITRNLAPSYHIPVELTISNAVVRNFLTLVGCPNRTLTIYSTPPIIAWMELATGINQGAVGWANLNAYYAAQGTAAVNAIVYLMNNVFSDGTNTGYGNARMSLIQNFGQYCSYCGMPVYDTSLAVEHMLPKASFPDVMMCYPNFLLACTACNSLNKMDHPSYTEARDWCINKVHIPVPTYGQIKLGGIDRYVWPDDITIFVDNTNAYFGFVLDLWKYAVAPNPASKLPDVQAYSLQNFWINTDNNMVTANVWDGTSMLQTISVYTNYRAENTLPPNEPERILNMINMVQLNKTKPDDNKMTDRRMINRTVAFFEVLQALNRLQVCATTLPFNQAFFDLLAQQVITTARYSGFYEVWVAIIYVIAPPPVQPPPPAPPVFDNSFYTKFKTNTTTKPSAGGNAAYYFPGTDKTRLP